MWWGKGDGDNGERETEGSLSWSVHAKRKTPGQETGGMNVWVQWKTLDDMDNILLVLGNLVCSHNIAPDSLLRMCVLQTTTHHTYIHTARCSPPVITALANTQSLIWRRAEKVDWKGKLKSASCLWCVFTCKQSYCCECVSVSLSH